MTTDEHYIVSPDKHLIQFDYAEQTVTLVDIKVNNDTAIDNKLIYGSVQGLKLDEDGKPIVGAVFGLFAKDETEFTEENALMTAVSGEDGVFIWGILVGTGDNDDEFKYSFVDWQKDGRSYRYEKN